MKRKILQIILVLVLLYGATSQALACVSLQSDIHSCCRVLSANQTATRLAAKTNRKAATLPPCCIASPPVTPQQAAVNHRTSQTNATDSTLTNRASESCFVVKLPFKPKPVCEPAGYSPPSFILHHALLI